jgi:hypothetical protein
MGAGLQSDKDVGAAGPSAGGGEGHRLGVRPAALLRRAFADNLAACANDASHRWIRRCPAELSLGEQKRARHRFGIVQDSTKR